MGGRARETFDYRLTPQEVRVLNLIGHGLTSRQIAKQLGITFKTAHCHRWRILQKMATSSSAHAVRLAIRAGILEA